MTGFPAEQPTRSYEFDHFCLDLSRRLLFYDGQPVHIPPKAIKILQVLIERRNRVVDADELMDLLWPDQLEVGENCLSFHISKLRRALGESPRDHRYIVTIPRIGYQFVADVKKRVSGCVSKPVMVVRAFNPFTQSTSFTLHSFPANNLVQNQNGRGWSMQTEWNGTENIVISGFNQLKITSESCTVFPEVQLADYQDVSLGLSVRDLELSVLFYRRLGFILDRKEPQLAEMRWGKLTILLEQLDQWIPLSDKPHGRLNVQVTDIEAVWECVTRYGIPILKKISQYEDGTRNFVVLGPDGLAVRFASGHPIIKCFPNTSTKSGADGLH